MNEHTSTWINKVKPGSRNFIIHFIIEIFSPKPFGEISLGHEGRERKVHEATERLGKESMGGNTNFHEWSWYVA